MQKKIGDTCNLTTPERTNRRFKVMNIEVLTKFEDLSVNEIEENYKCQRCDEVLIILKYPKIS